MRRIAVALAALILFAAPVAAQGARLAIGAKKLTIHGTSNVHDWSCSTSTFTAAIVVPPAGAADLGRNIEDIEVSIPVKSIDCGNGQMTGNLQKAMNAERQPTVYFRLQSYGAMQSAGGWAGTARGSLTINGVTRPATLTGKVTPDGRGNAQAQASASLRTTDFGIQPVKALLGSIRTGETVRIAVTVNVTAPASALVAQAPPRAAPSEPAAAPKPTSQPARRTTEPAAPPTRPAPTVTDVSAAQRRAAPGTVVPPAERRAAPADTTRPVVTADSVVVDTVIIRDTVVVREMPGDVTAPKDTAPPVDMPAEAPAEPTAQSQEVAPGPGVPPIRIQHMRPRDQRGVFLFEAPKSDTVSYTGFALQWGAAFTQEFQDLSHRNTATPVIVGTTNQNQLMVIGAGFNNAVANLYLDAQLAKGIRVALASYLSSRHHQETWVKDGYFLIDASPVDNELLDVLMSMITLKLGHFEVNYGDAHFRRTDNGQAMYNPLVGNLILDAFTTEIGFEGYFRLGPLLAMAGATGGEIRGQVTGPERRSPAWLGKVGFDRQVSGDLRIRLTGSTYGSAKSRSNTLYTGDRAGSPYFMVLENTAATETANAWSGNLRPGFANVVHAYMANPFVKFRGLELFGTVETATGKASTEARKRTIRQLAGEGVLRAGSREQFYVAGRYNRVAGELQGIANDITVNKYQVGGGWFVLPTVLAKLEYVEQRYHDFPATDIRNGGKFSGLVVAGTVAF